MTTDLSTQHNFAVPVPPGRGLWWVVTCTVAAAVGIALARPAAELVRKPLSQVFDGLPTVAVFGAVFGACVGLGRALVQRRPSGPHPAWWVVACLLSGAVGYVLGAELSAAVTDPLRGRVLVYLSEVLAYLVLGAVMGLLLGGVEWGLGRARGHGVVRWIALSMLGWALGFVVAAGVGLLITSLPSVTVRDLLFGGVTGLVVGALEVLRTAHRPVA
jgi:hypothetical protein